MTITNILSRSAAAAAGSALMFATLAPALADTRPSTDQSGEQQHLQVVHDGKGHTKYCAKMPAVTGSILRPKVCKTAKQWKADGVDIGAAANGHIAG